MDEQSRSFQFDDVRVDAAAFKVWKAGRAVPLEPKALEVLLFLIERRGRVVQKSELLDAIWKGAFVTENALTREIALLRKALGEEARRARYIETVPTRGYRFIAEVRNDEGPESWGRETLEADAFREGAPAAGSAAEPTQATAAHGADAYKPVRGTSVGTRSSSSRRARRVAAFAVAALAVCLAALAALRLMHSGAAKVDETIRVRRLSQLTTTIGLDTYPSLSPDGAYVAYCSTRAGGIEIFVKQVARGAREIQVTADGGHNFQPAWSPDGQHLAFHSQKRGGVWVVPALGGVARRLTEFGSKPAWSPDGRQIAFQSASLTDLSGQQNGALPPSTLWVVAAQGGAPRQLTQVGTPPGGHGSPVWWPDGKRLLFYSFDLTTAEVWSVGLDDGGLKQLAPKGQPFGDIIFAPDGRHVYCAGIFKGGSFGLWRVPVSLERGAPTGEPEKVEGTGNTPIRHLSISSDGKRIAYSANSLASNIWQVRLDPQTGEPAGPPIPLYEDTSLRKTNPVFSPDGSRVAFGVWRLGSPASIWLVAADGANPGPLTADETGSGFPSWMPDGGRVAFVSSRDGRPAVWVRDLSTGREQPLRELDQGVSFPRLSPDGRLLAFNSRRGRGVINVWTLPVEGGDARRLTFDEEMAGFPCWSPDGRWLAVELKRGEDQHVALMPSGGGEVVQLTREPGLSWPHSFSPDGDRVAFAGRRDGVWNVYWVSRSTGQQRRLTGFTKPNAYVRYPAWSPRGDQIVFEYAETTGNVWLLELQ